MKPRGDEPRRTPAAPQRGAGLRPAQPVAEAAASPWQRAGPGPLTHRQGRPGLPRLHAGVAIRGDYTTRRSPTPPTTGPDGRGRDRTRPPVLAVPRRAHGRSHVGTPDPRSGGSVPPLRLCEGAAHAHGGQRRRCPEPRPSLFPCSAGGHWASRGRVGAVRAKVAVRCHCALISSYLMVICGALAAASLQKRWGKRHFPLPPAPEVLVAAVVATVVPSTCGYDPVRKQNPEPNWKKKAF